MKNRIILLLMGAIAALQALHAQDESASGEPRLLPVTVQVTMNGGHAKQFSVVLFKDNQQVVDLPPGNRSAFEFALDLEAYYTIRISKEGYQEKILYVDTHLPNTEWTSYKPYACLVNLESQDKFARSDPFYLDFPSAVVKWDAGKGSFDHSDQYLSDIQLKMALLSAQAEPDQR